MKKIKERFGEDKQRQQQEMMALYKREGANPVSGCLPIFIQIPVFFALYNILFVHHRDAACAVLRLDTRSVGTRSRSTSSTCSA